VVVVAGRRQAEQRLEQAVDVGGGEQVAAAHHVGDALRGIVDGDREMVAHRRVLAGEDDVAERSGSACTSPSPSRQRAGPGQPRGAGDVEPPGMRLVSARIFARARLRRQPRQVPG
jgi:hypothetical protein